MPPPESPKPVADAALIAPTPLAVHADKRVELLSILNRFAGAPEYRKVTDAYAVDVDRAFGAFVSHPAVRATAELRAKYGIGYDAPMLFAVHLDDAWQLQRADELPSIDKRFTGVDVAAYAAQVRDFAVATKLDAFVAAHASAYAEAETALRAMIGGDDLVGFYDQIFGKRPDARYTVVPSLLSGPHNFGVRAGNDTYQILGNTATLGLLVHELGHSYINAIFARHAAELAPAGTAIYPIVATAMRAQQYTTWQTMFDEAGVRALTVLYMFERKGDRAGAAAARDELRHAFWWIDDLVEVFRKCKRDHAGDFETCMPAIVAFYDALATQYAAHPPLMPFVGPFDAIWWNDRVLSLPATPELVRYVRGLPFAAKLPAMSTDVDHTPNVGIVAYGSPTTNPVVAQAAAWGLWKITPDGIELGAKKFAGQHLVLIACWFRRDDPPHGIAVYAAADDKDLVGVNSIRHGPNDWLVARKTAKGYEIVEAGDWVFENGAWVPFVEQHLK